MGTIKRLVSPFLEDAMTRRYNACGARRKHSPRLSLVNIKTVSFVVSVISTKQIITCYNNFLLAETPVKLNTA